MESIDINQALPKISELLNRAFSGEEIIITNQNQPKIKISAISVNSQRPPLFGSDRADVQKPGPVYIISVTQPTLS